MKALQPFTLKNLKLKNRIVMPPMCMFNAKEDGLVTDFHLAHYMTRAYGGVGLIIVEATGVTSDGRISKQDLGLWNDEQIESMKKLVDMVKGYGSHIGIQLNHGGRKYSGADVLVGPSAIPYDEKSQVPKELTKKEIQEIAVSFGEAARRADQAGFDTIEIHAAHGYLIHQFLSPISNQRTDEYGGSTVNRRRFLDEVLDEVHKNWPATKALTIRVSGTEWREDGYTEQEMVDIIHEIRERVDLVHVTSSGNGPAEIDVYPGYQLGPCENIRKSCNVPTIAVGRITTIGMVEEILGNGRADLVAMGKELLRQPNFIYNMAYERKMPMDYPFEFERAYRF